MSGSESWNEEQIDIQMDYSENTEYTATAETESDSQSPASMNEQRSEIIDDSILASVIAQAVADSISAREVVPEENDPATASNLPDMPPVAEQQDINPASFEQTGPSAAETADIPPAYSGEESSAPSQASEETTESERHPNSVGPKQRTAKASVQKQKKRQRISKADVPKPGTVMKKIDHSHLRPDTSESVKLLLADIHTRHREMLPAASTSPKSWQKRQTRIYTVNHSLNPIRYIICILMAMCLAGRKYSWMSLGFMSGISGMYVALMMTGLALLINWQAVWKSVKSVFYLRFPFETLLLITTVVSACDAYVNTNENTLLPIAAMAWCFAGLAMDRSLGASLYAVRGLLSLSKPIGIRAAKTKWEGNDCIGKARSSTEGAVRHLSEPDLLDNIFSIFVLPYLIAVVLAGIYLSARFELNLLHILSQLMLPGLPISLLWSCARPYELMCAANKGRGLISGWYGIKKLSGKKVILISDEDLFPEGTILCRGFKSFVRVTDRTLLSYAASLALEADIGFNDPFIQLMREANGGLMHVSACVPEEGGAKGVIHDDLVRIGSKEYMQLNGVRTPDKAGRYNIYIAVNGVLAGEFRMKYSEQKSARRILGAISSESGLTPLLTAHNCYVNPRFVQRLFRVSISDLVCPKLTTRRELAGKETMNQSAVCGYVARSGVAAYGDLVCRARRVYRTSMVMSAIATFLTLLFTVRSAFAIARGTAMIPGIQLVVIHLFLLLFLELSARIAARR